MPDITRDRKLKAVLAAMILIFLGLFSCLAAGVWRANLGLVLGGLYVSFVGGIGAALALFINGNVKVHQAQNPTPGVKP